MSQWNETPPQLGPMSQCDKSLDFQPLAPWPKGLPAVAVNWVVLAGFEQDLVFNHLIEPSDTERISALFRSLYFELSFAEMARLIDAAKSHKWFPVIDVAQKFSWNPNEQFFQIASALMKMPAGFQKWASDKKVSAHDLAPLLSASTVDLKYLLNDIIQLNLSKSLGIKALELGIELLLLGHKAEDLSSTHIFSDELARGLAAVSGDHWLEALKQLRFPETYKRDLVQQEKMTSLPWPGTTHARWVRQGDKAGIELKLFVSQPSDLKKYLQSLNRVQDLMEQEPSGTQH